MDGEIGYGAAYKGSKQYTQWEVPTANATGFGAAADDYMERGIDLNEQLVHNKPATFFFRMNSDAMIGAGIFSGDTLVVDRSIKPVSGKIIIAILDGELLVRRLHKTFNQLTLIAENKKFSDIQLSGFDERAQVWGVVTYSIHAV
ncbi:LexA family protein [Sediminibacterium sp.]|uniref:LexA family protein n=1 Tax=Sediminibacterium sp. TaxID=1917865 RepID=UPI003F6EEF60